MTSFFRIFSIIAYLLIFLQGSMILLPFGSTNGSQINFTWVPNGGTGSASDKDKVILLVYSSTQKQCFYCIGDALRGAGSTTLDAWFFAGEQVHTWLAFITEDGSRKSESVYTGSVELS